MALATECANAWIRPPSGSAQPFYPWSDKAWNSTLAAPGRRQLSQNNCATPQYLGRDINLRFIRVRCSPDEQEFLANEDAFVCSAHNLAEHPNLLFQNDVNACSSFGVYLGAHPKNLRTLQNFVEEIEEEVPRRVLDNAISRFTANRTLAEHDSEILTQVYDEEYTRVSESDGDVAARTAVGTRIERAVDSLRTKVELATGVFGPECADSINSDTRDKLGGHTGSVQGRRTCRMLLRTMRTYEKIWQEAEATANARLEGSTPSDAERRDAVRAEAGLTLWARIASQSICAGDVSTSYDMNFRMFLYEGLTPAEQQAISPRDETESADATSGSGSSARKLALFRWSTEFGGFGRPSFGEITNGYVYGGHRERRRFIGSGRRQTGSVNGSNDCSTFIAGVINPDSRGADSPTTEVFEIMSRDLNKESLNAYERGKIRPWRRIQSCLEPVDYRVTAPRASDILVNRTAGDAHIVLVHSYNRDTGRVRTLEATGSSESNNTIDFTVERSIYEPSCLGNARTADADWQVRPVRAGLTALRFKSNPPRSCPLRQN